MGGQKLGSFLTALNFGLYLEGIPKGSFGLRIALIAVTIPRTFDGTGEDDDYQMSENTRSEWGGILRCRTSDGRIINMADELNRIEREKENSKKQPSVEPEGQKLDVPEED